MNIFQAIGKLFTTLLVNPIINILIAIYLILTALHVPYALGFAIILLTVLIRLLLYPLTLSQLKAAKKMQDLAPHISHVKNKHKGDSKKIQEETMRLYKEHGVNPAAGCLPALLQLPIILALYSVLQLIVNGHGLQFVIQINKILYFPFLHLKSSLDQTFFGLPLGQSPSHLLPIYGPLILLFPIVTALLQFIQSKMMVPMPSTPPAVVIKKTDEKKSEKKEDDFASAMQTQTMYIFPLMIGYFSFNFPLGLSLYWITFTIFGIIQQYQISGMGGLQPWIDKVSTRLKQNNKE